MDEKSYIKDNRIYGVSICEHFNVKLNNNENPAINPTIVMDDMPVAIMKKLIHEALKVRGRPAMKSMDGELLKKTYKGKLSWRIFFNKAGADIYKSQITMSDDELETEIKRLKAMKSQPKDDFDQAVENLEMDEDKNTEISNGIDEAVDELIAETSEIVDDNE